MKSKQQTPFFTRSRIIDQRKRQIMHRRRTSVVLFTGLMMAAVTATSMPGGILQAGASNVAEAKKRYKKRGVSIEVSKGRIVRLSRPAKTVFVADPNVADVQVKSSRMIYLFGKKVGETTLIAVDSNDRVLLNVGVTVNHNITRLRRAIDAVVPRNRVRIRSIDGAILLTGRVRNQAQAIRIQDIAARFVQDAEKNLVNQISVSGPNQVNVRVRIVEVNKDTLKRLGINWDVAIRTGQFVFGLATGIATTVAGQFGTFNSRTGTSFSSNSLGINYSYKNVDLNGLIDALDREGLIKVLAEPNLSAMNGKKASFLAGGEFPVPIPQDGGVITVEYKKFGVSLAVTPVIMGRNRIKMTIAPEVSTLSQQNAVNLNNIQIPSLLTRRAETMVQVASGQSIVIGGLFLNNVTKDIRKVPWLGDIPVLGKLFTSQEFQRNETELVIIATPYLVKPFNAKTQAARIVGASGARGSRDLSRRGVARAVTGAGKGPVRIVRGPAVAGKAAGAHRSSGYVLE